MCGFDHATILIPLSTVSSRNAWHNDQRFACVADALNLLYRRVREPAGLCPKYDEKARGEGEYLQKNWVWMCGRLPETLFLVQTKSVIFRTLFQT